MPQETLGLLVIGARLEEGSPSPLRAEVRITKDVSAGFEHVLNFSNADAVIEIVREWLQHIVEGGPASPSTTAEEH